MKTKQFKYIIVSNGDAEIAILFNPFIVHSCIKVEKFKIVSAGFCKFIFDDRFEKGLIVEANGESVSLKIKSREIDRDIIYKTAIPGPWDYHMSSDDPLYSKLDNRIKEKLKAEELHET